jgi:hypothetical protein
LAKAYADSERAIWRAIRSVPGVLDAVQSHSMAAEAAWLSGDYVQFARETDAELAALAARYGERSTVFSVSVCSPAIQFAAIRDVANAISYARRCLTLPSGITTWNLRLSPWWQGILSDSRVQAFLREFEVRTP